MEFEQATNESEYEDTVDVEFDSLTGGGREEITLTELRKPVYHGILSAFADDIDIQQIVVHSTNLGFVRRYTKRRKGKTPVKPGEIMDSGSANNIQVGGEHYKSKAIQPWDFIVSNNIGFLEGNVIKYVSRWRDKGGIEDLRKAQHYLAKLIEVNDADSK